MTDRNELIKRIRSKYKGFEKASDDEVAAEVYKRFPKDYPELAPQKPAPTTTGKPRPKEPVRREEVRKLQDTAKTRRAEVADLERRIRKNSPLSEATRARIAKENAVLKHLELTPFMDKSAVEQSRQRLKMLQEQHVQNEAMEKKKNASLYAQLARKQSAFQASHEAYVAKDLEARAAPSGLTKEEIRFESGLRTGSIKAYSLQTTLKQFEAAVKPRVDAKRYQHALDYLKKNSLRDKVTDETLEIAKELAFGSANEPPEASIPEDLLAQLAAAGMPAQAKPKNPFEARELTAKLGRDLRLRREQETMIALEGATPIVSAGLGAALGALTGGPVGAVGGAFIGYGTTSRPGAALYRSWVDEIPFSDAWEKTTWVSSVGQELAKDGVTGPGGAFLIDFALGLGAGATGAILARPLNTVMKTKMIQAYEARFGVKPADAELSKAIKQAMTVYKEGIYRNEVMPDAAPVQTFARLGKERPDPTIKYQAAQANLQHLDENVALYFENSSTAAEAASRNSVAPGRKVVLQDSDRTAGYYIDEYGDVITSSHEPRGDILQRGDAPYLVRPTNGVFQLQGGALIRPPSRVAEGTPVYLFKDRSQIKDVPEGAYISFTDELLDNQGNNVSHLSNTELRKNYGLPFFESKEDFLANYKTQPGLSDSVYIKDTRYRVSTDGHLMHARALDNLANDYPPTVAPDGEIGQVTNRLYDHQPGDLLVTPNAQVFRVDKNGLPVFHPLFGQYFDYRTSSGTRHPHIYSELGLLNGPRENATFLLNEERVSFEELTTRLLLEGEDISVRVINDSFEYVQNMLPKLARGEAANELQLVLNVLTDAQGELVSFTDLAARSQFLPRSARTVLDKLIEGDIRVGEMFTIDGTTYVVGDFTGVCTNVSGRPEFPFSLDDPAFRGVYEFSPRPRDIPANIQDYLEGKAFGDPDLEDLYVSGTVAGTHLVGMDVNGIPLEIPNEFFLAPEVKLYAFYPTLEEQSMLRPGDFVYVSNALMEVQDGQLTGRWLPRTEVETDIPTAASFGDVESAEQALEELMQAARDAQATADTLSDVGGIGNVFSDALQNTEPIHVRNALFLVEANGDLNVIRSLQEIKDHLESIKLREMLEKSSDKLATDRPAAGADSMLTDQLRATLKNPDTNANVDFKVSNLSLDGDWDLFEALGLAGDESYYLAAADRLDPHEDIKEVLQFIMQGMGFTDEVTKLDALAIKRLFELVDNLANNVPSPELIGFRYGDFIKGHGGKFYSLVTYNLESYKIQRVGSKVAWTDAIENATAHKVTVENPVFFLNREVAKKRLFAPDEWNKLIENLQTHGEENYRLEDQLIATRAGEYGYDAIIYADDDGGFPEFTYIGNYIDEVYHDPLDSVPSGDLRASDISGQKLPKQDVNVPEPKQAAEVPEGEATTAGAGGEPPKEPPKKPPTAEDDIPDDLPEGDPNPSIDYTDVTSARNDYMRQDLEEMMNVTLDEPQKESFRGWYAQAQKENIASQADTIAAAVNKEPRSLAPKETAGLVIRAQELKNLHRALRDAMKKADAEDLANMANELEAVEDQFMAIAKALRTSGTEEGRALVARKLTIDKGYDLLEVKERARASKRGDLTQAQTEKLTTLVDELDTVTKNIADVEAEQAAKIVDAEANVSKFKTAKERAVADREKLLGELDELFKKMSGEGTDETPLASGLSWETIKDSAEAVQKIGQIALTYAREGIADLGELLTRMKVHVPDMELEDLKAAIVETGREYSPAKQRTEIQKELAHLKSLKSRRGKAARRIKELEEQLETGIFPVKEKRKTRADEQLDSLRRVQRDLQRDIDRQIRALKPRKAPMTEAIDKYMSAAMLSNPYARMFDVAANSVKLVSFLGTHKLRNAVSTAMDYLLFKGAHGAKDFRISMSTAERILEGARGRWADQWSEILKDADADVVAKYGLGNIFQKVAGLTDLPFKDFYRRVALHDYAVSKARSMSQHNWKANFDHIWSQLTDPESASNLLSHADIDAAHLISEDFALRNTFNVTNFVSRLADGMQEALSRAQAKEGRLGAEFIGVGKIGVRVLTRFSRVIGNVALERANFIYPSLSLGEAGLRTTKVIAQTLAKEGIDAKEAKLISDLITKGLVGVGLVELGKALYRYTDADPELMKTDNGTLYFKEDVIERIGSGGLSAVSHGIRSAKIDDLEKRRKITPEQATALRWKTGVNVLANQPMFTGPRNLEKLTKTPEVAFDYIADQVFNNLIPGGIRQWARTQDAVKEGEGLLGDPPRRKAETLWEHIMERTPFLREQLEAKKDKEIKRPRVRR